MSFTENTWVVNLRHEEENKYRQTKQNRGNKDIGKQTGYETKQEGKEGKLFCLWLSIWKGERNSSEKFIF